MNHAKLVQLGTDLMAELQAPERWLPQYDEALGSSTDEKLVEFVNQASRALHISVRAAA